MSWVTSGYYPESFNLFFQLHDNFFIIELDVGPN